VEDAWYDRVRRGEQASFDTFLKLGAAASVEVLVRGAVAEASWIVRVIVRWK
jgi:hypothetical protein